MAPLHQRQLIEEFVRQLPLLPHQCLRKTHMVNLQHSQARDQRLHLAPSASMPTLTAAYLAAGVPRIPARGRITDYTGWILAAHEYQRFGYAVHTAVQLSRLFGADGDEYVLVGDPTQPGPQVNCVTGTSKRPNVQLTVHPAEVKWSVAGAAAAAAAGAGAGAGAGAACGGDRTALVTNSYVTVRALKPLRAGEELWLDYGLQYWEDMSLYCPHCLEYGADADNCMLLCEAPGCKRAWHQLCLRPCLVEVPDGPFYCDIHSNQG